MQQDLLLDYLCASSHIPVWLFDADKTLLYCSERNEGLLAPQDINAFFEGLLQKASAVPTLYAVGGMELYAFFTYAQAQQTCTAILGPAFNIRPVHPKTARQALSIAYLYTQEAARAKLLLTPHIDVDGFVQFTCVVLALLRGEEHSAAQLKQSLDTISLRFAFNQVLTGKLFNLREEIELPTHDYEMEQKYLRAVRDGDVERLKKQPQLTVLPVKNELSADPHKQFLYEMIALVTLVTRAAIEGGLDVETAYTMSDLYIRQMDAAKTTEEVLRLSQNVALDFAIKIREQKQTAPDMRNRSVQACIAYIRAHLHLPISLPALAAHVGLNDKYLSRLFIKETGMKLTQFIQRERVMEAKSLLAYSDYSLLDISNYLAFSSQSYFIKVFQKHTGMTPQQYKQTNRR